VAKKKKSDVGDILRGMMNEDAEEDEITKEVPVPVPVEEPKVMAEPPKPLVEPEKPAPKAPAKKLVEEKAAEPGTKRLLDHNPTMLRKHHSIMNQKAPSSRKYFQSR